ncbi:hypothetical protein HWB57_gp041 [Erwinia phage vB_EamM-Bue1]|uniref:Uncharacterized protein n=2 Tax=Nezavisimistyvirus TaxID=2841279 RepID=A0A2P1JU52_9CAUD|nr:putative GTPase-activator protein [Erwinia phage phiEa2809]YP_009837640.1 hypothetical protein HWB57_gp041 [Erwinia phage vB_EamM-Bue1]AIX13042.1 putative GTPase-activator protein [Erwinia phage phiEa2809]AVO22881.1 hypothetical protein [Erwinia phage vB_EamM-Bue1]
MNALLTKELIQRAEGMVQQTITLSGPETAQFFDERPHWPECVSVSQRPGKIIQLPWKALPNRAHTEERYFINGSEVKPAFAFWGLANSVRGRNNVN